jgi:hypothetical protein
MFSKAQVVLTIQDLAKGVDNRGQRDIILLDFSKAFDKIPHQRLLHKIHHYGITGTTYAWLMDFLKGRDQRVVLGGCTSKTAPVSSGVPQGSILVPLLFMLFINDLPKYVSSTAKVRLFADDCVLYRDITSPSCS